MSSRQARLVPCVQSLVATSALCPVVKLALPSYYFTPTSLFTCKVFGSATLNSDDSRSYYLELAVNDLLSNIFSNYIKFTIMRPSASVNNTMPLLLDPQQSDWSNNVYVLTATRVLVMIGVAYLIRSLYSLVPSIWGTRSASIAAGALPCTSNIDRGKTRAKK